MIGFKLLQKLNQKKYRQQHGLFLVEGKRGVLDALQSSADVQAIVVSRSFQAHTDPALETILQETQRQSLIQVVDDGSFAKLSDTATPQGILVVCRIPQYTISDFYTYKRIALLEDIRDPGNLGTMIRTADWFGLDGIILLDGADPYQPKVVRSSMGSLFHIPLVSLPNLTAVEELQKHGFSLVATRPESTSTMRVLDMQSPLIIAFGSEAHGTSSGLDRLADASFSLPKYGKAESLNVAVSFGIVWHEVLRTEARN